MGTEDLSERQAHLSLRWETRQIWPEIAALLKIRRNPEHVAAAATALYVEGVGQGRWTSYSRAKDHYDVPQRYRSSLYTYRKVVGSADHLDALGLIQHEKARPGQRGWQSAMCATPELVQVVHDATDGQIMLSPLREPVLLRDRDKNLVDYRDNTLTDRMRRETQVQNEAIMGSSYGDV